MGEMPLSDEEIVRRYLAGEFQNEIAHADGRHGTTIHRILARYGIMLRNPHEERVKSGKIHGKTGGAISGKTNILRARASLTLEKLKAGGRIAGKLAVETGQLAALDQGRKNKETGEILRAQRIGANSPVVREWRRQHGRENYQAGLWNPLSGYKTQDTKPELIIKAILDQKGIRYEHPFKLGDKFLCDFYLSDHNLIIEVDGCYWHGCEECGYPGRKKGGDAGRNAYIEACGYLLLIIKEHELLGWVDWNRSHSKLQRP